MILAMQSLQIVLLTQDSWSIEFYPFCILISVSGTSQMFNDQVSCCVFLPLIFLPFLICVYVDRNLQK